MEDLENISQIYSRITFLTEQINGLKEINPNKLPLNIVLPALEKKRDDYRIEMVKLIEKNKIFKEGIHFKD